MKLLVTRHGKTVWNEQRRTQGRVHNRLSKSGIESSNITAEKLKNESIDLIFSSPLLRSVQTANIINKFHHKKIIKDDRIIDIDQGFFTGKYFDKLTEEEHKIKRSRAKDYGMESLKEMHARVNNFLEFLKENYGNSTVLVVTHSGVASFIEFIVKYGDFNAEIFSRTDLFDNAEIKEFLI